MFIQQIKIKGKKKKLIALDELPSFSGKSVGAIFAINEIAKRLGITTALGKDRNAKLALRICRIRL